MEAYHTKRLHLREESWGIFGRLSYHSLQSVVHNQVVASFWSRTSTQSLRASPTTVTATRINHFLRLCQVASWDRSRFPHRISSVQRESKFACSTNSIRRNTSSSSSSSFYLAHGRWRRSRVRESKSSYEKFFFVRSLIHRLSLWCLRLLLKKKDGSVKIQQEDK